MSHRTRASLAHSLSPTQHRDPDKTQSRPALSPCLPQYPGVLWNKGPMGFTGRDEKPAPSALSPSLGRGTSWRQSPQPGRLEPAHLTGPGAAAGRARPRVHPRSPGALNSVQQDTGCRRDMGSNRGQTALGVTSSAQRCVGPPIPPHPTPPHS